METDNAVSGLPRPSRLDDIEGWFYAADQRLFDWLLRYQWDCGTIGDLLELGAYLGKSAVFLGRYLRDDDRFTVCDLFESSAPDAAGAAEMRAYYSTLTRQRFEANYLSFHDRLPAIVQGATSIITSHVEPASCRFVHIDASHLYHHVRSDINTARDLLVTDGVIVLDDYRSAHTPGVAAATWEAVLTGGLKPIMVSASKFYGTWGDAAKPQQTLLTWLTSQPGLRGHTEQVAGRPLILVHAE